MQAWRFLLPSFLGFLLRNLAHASIDKLRGAPARTIQSAAYVAANAQRESPGDVLHTLDRFAREERWLMSVGPKKGPLIEELAARLPPNARVLEIGAYCGYSSIMMAKAYGSDVKITSIEIDADSVASATANVEHAGLSEQVEFLHGPSSKVLEQLNEEYDLIFLDHWKNLYKSDLQLIEQRGLIKPGSIVVADNVGKVFGPEQYLSYVRNSGRYECESRVTTVEYTSIADAVEISVCVG
ncbi:MAG: O-methyltransferase [Pseudomonadales bacterium]